VRAGDGVMRGTEGAGRDQRRARVGKAGDPVNTRGLNGHGEDHGRETSGQPPGQH
jgi:hypothetical protein